MTSTHRLRGGLRHRTVALLGVLALTAALLTLGAAPADAAAQLNVSKTSGLVDGDSVTVSGSGFTPGMTQIAVGQCREPFSGPGDCHLAGGATFVNADGSGNIPSVQLTIGAQFNGFDCTTQSCVVAAQILPGAADEAEVAANRAKVAITFAADEPDPEPEPDPDPDPDPSEDAGDDTEVQDASTEADQATGLPNTGPMEQLPVSGLWSSVLLLFGVSVLLLSPRRRAEVRR